MADNEKNRFSARAARYARVGAKVGGVAARYAGRRILGGTPNRLSEASALASALGNLKGPLMKVAQLMAIRRRLDFAIDTSEIGKEISARVREELDYRREAKHVALYRIMLEGCDIVRVPRAWPELSTGRLLTLDWLDGTRMLAHKNDP